MNPNDIPDDQRWRLTRPRELMTLDPILTRLLVILLRHYAKAARHAIMRMSSIPKKDRPDWYENSLRYWKHVERGFKWAIHHTERIPKPHGTTPKHSTQATNTILPIRGNDSTYQPSRKIRDWFEPL